MGRLRELGLVGLVSGLVVLSVGCARTLNFGKNPIGWYEGSDFNVSSFKAGTGGIKPVVTLGFPSQEDSNKYRKHLREDAIKNKIPVLENETQATLSRQGTTAVYSFYQKNNQNYVEVFLIPTR